MFLTLCRRDSSERTLSRQEPSLEGQRQKRLTILVDVPKERWLPAICDCGKCTFVRRDVWKAGKYRSCGCEKPNQSHKQTGTRLYHIWDNMLARCTRPNSTFFKNYGGRKDKPVTVCEEWRKSENFFKWALANGYRDEPNWLPSERLEIDRIDPEGNYEPSNCRFVTRADNNKNTRKAKLDKRTLRTLDAEAKQGRHAERTRKGHNDEPVQKYSGEPGDDVPF